MTPVENWRRLLRRAWSIRLIALAVVLSGVEAAFGVMTAFAIKPDFVPAGLFAAGAFAVSVAAFIARLIAQKD